MSILAQQLANVAPFNSINLAVSVVYFVDALKDDGDSVALGLYVMRRTGLRIGELRRLKRDCVRVDHQGQAALKVPLGKMNNERVVPLDEATLAAVTTLQDRAREDGD